MEGTLCQRETTILREVETPQRIAQDRVPRLQVQTEEEEGSFPQAVHCPRWSCRHQRQRILIGRQQQQQQ